MIIWMIIIIILDVFLIVSIYHSFPPSVIYIIAYAILLTTVGILYRIFKKMRVGKYERLEAKAKKLIQENNELRLMDEINVKEKTGNYG